jgi:hypothetical protein
MNKGTKLSTVAGFPTLEDTQERLAVDTPTADLDRSSRDNSVRNSIAIAEMEGGQPSGRRQDLRQAKARL